MVHFNVTTSNGTMKRSIGQNYISSVSFTLVLLYNNTSVKIFDSSPCEKIQSAFGAS